MRPGASALVDDYLEQVSDAINAIRSSRGEPETDSVSKAEFSAHSLAAVLCVSGGRFLPVEASSTPAA